MSYNLTRVLNNLTYEINNREELTFINSNDEHIIPRNNTIKIYSRDNNNLMLLNDLGIETDLTQKTQTGVYMLTSEARTVVFSGSLLPFNMLENATFVGSLEFLNGFEVSAYNLKIVGLITLSNDASLHIKLYSNVRAIGILVVTNMPALTGCFYEINIDFSIRQKGNLSGNAFTNLEFSYSNANTISYPVNYIRQISNGSIDTTVSNTLIVTIETPNGAIGWQVVKHCILTKVY